MDYKVEFLHYISNLVNEYNYLLNNYNGVDRIYKITKMKNDIDLLLMINKLYVH